MPPEPTPKPSQPEELELSYVKLREGCIAPFSGGQESGFWKGLPPESRSGALRHDTEVVCYLTTWRGQDTIVARRSVRKGRVIRIPLTSVAYYTLAGEESGPDASSKASK